MNIIFNELARDEFNDAVAYYELKTPGLGKRFRGEVRRAAMRIAEYPEIWPAEKGDVRKYLLHKFPYKILYSIEADHIFIITVAHQHRRPDYWAGRLLSAI
ncbi:MAG: type II toxin-antitoxin system RelE/ParE family toxin [Deltaproteobacteria bacterium]|nr:MAG: type II toxin-antitoxin system RelE/ParE family toxin [Deltaproteobacteria bacterium]